MTFSTICKLVSRDESDSRSILENNLKFRRKFLKLKPFDSNIPSLQKTILGSESYPTNSGWQFVPL